VELDQWPAPGVVFCLFGSAKYHRLGRLGSQGYWGGLWQADSVVS
jgi:hypothetical protein